MFTIQHSDSLFQGSHQPEDAARIVAKGPSGKELETKLMRNGKNWEQDLETLLPSVVSGPFLATSVAVSSSATKSDNFADRPYSYGMWGKLVGEAFLIYHFTNQLETWLKQLFQRNPSINIAEQLLQAPAWDHWFVLPPLHAHSCQTPKHSK